MKKVILLTALCLALGSICGAEIPFEAALENAAITLFQDPVRKRGAEAQKQES